MPEISGSIVALVIVAGAAAGGLGSMLGLGGGVFLVPFLNVALGFPLNVASGVGLMTVIATSSVVARGTDRSGVVNLRLGMVLQIAAAAGGYFGGRYARRIPEHALQVMFAAVTAAIAAIMLSRLERRNVILDTRSSPDRSAAATTRRKRPGDRVGPGACRRHWAYRWLPAASPGCSVSAAASCRSRRSTRGAACRSAPRRQPAPS